MGGIDSSPTQSDRIRLHITPFNADLYDRIIPPSLQPLASDTSFHTIQTFPERGFGFVELPAMEAQKLRKKLNGSTLKGTKMSVEEARPSRKRKSDAADDEEGKKKAKCEKKEKRRREDGVLAGHEIEDGRRVKRGWTGDESRNKKDKKERVKADDSSEERKMRFKAKIPPNKTPTGSEREKKKKDKKSKKDKSKGEVVVEEFTKRRETRQDGPVVDAAVPGSSSYEDGKGWVDEAGNVIEPEPKSKRPKKQPSPEASPPATPQDTVIGAGEDQSQSVTDARDQLDKDGKDSDSVRSSSEGDSEPTPKALASQPKEVHPLEALFKPSAPAASKDTASTTTPTKPRPAPIDTSFSFFGSGGGGDDEDTEMAEGDAGAGAMPPVTPHTRQDLEWRSLRSAAPTPDTAAIGRKFSFPFAGNDEDDEGDGEEEEEGQDDGDGDEVMAATGPGMERGDESAFRKWFFENRGDLNRGWKKRRREERKARRQRENRRLGRKVA